MTAAEIAASLVRVREQIAQAAERAGRPADVIRLVAVTKTFPAETVRLAYDCGLRDFGENRVQEFSEKRLQLHLPEARFHLIGHLQSNKASAAIAFDWIHTLDNERVARRLNDAASEAGKTVSVLIQVKLDNGPAGQGLSERAGVPESAVEQFTKFAASQPQLQLRGLMTLPPFTEDPEGARPYFQRLRAMRDRLCAAGFPQLEELSMGMTHDFPVAIEEGATIVRIGAAIFGPRPERPPRKTNE